MYDPQMVATELYNAARGAGTDEDTFVRYMCSCHPDCYRQATVIFQQMYGKSLRACIASEFSLSSKFAFLLAHDYLNNPAEAVAFSVHQAVYGAGTDDDSLITATVLFSDYFRGPIIKTAYRQFGDMGYAIRTDLSGKYEDAVLGLWGLE
jgi:hypothetical protein